MTGASFSRRAARLFLVAVISLASLLGTQVRLASPAAAAPDGAVMRPTTVSMRADEIVTVDVLSNDDPPAGATWNRSSVCLVLAAGCLKQSSVDGFSWSVDAGDAPLFPDPALRGRRRHRVPGEGQPRHGVAVQARPQDRADGPRQRTPPADGPRPRLKVTQAVSPTTFDQAGQVLTWTSVVTNFGDVPLPVKVTDDSPAVSARSCAPVANLGTLAAGRVHHLHRDLPVQAAGLLDARDASTDAVRVATGTTTQDGRPSPDVRLRHGDARPPSRTQGLSLTRPRARRRSRGGAGRRLHFVVRNRGNLTLRDLVVTAPFPGAVRAGLLAGARWAGRWRRHRTTTCRATPDDHGRGPEGARRSRTPRRPVRCRPRPARRRGRARAAR